MVHMADNAPKSMFLTEAELVGVSSGMTYPDLSLAGQLGLGTKVPSLDAATPLVLPPAIVILLAAPTMYKNNDVMRKALKDMFETCAKSFTGIDIGYTADTDDVLISHDGQNLKMPKKVKRSEVSPSGVYGELRGNLIWNIHRKWMFDYQDPDTNTAFTRVNDGEAMLFVPSTYACTLLIIQPDPTGHPDNMIDATIISNVFPTETGELGMQKTTGEYNVPERTIAYTGFQEHSDFTRAVGRKVLADLQLYKLDYFGTNGSRYDDVEDNIKESGIQSELERFGITG
jgi:hypothetical protein